MRSSRPAARLAKVERLTLVDAHARPYLKATYVPAYEGSTRGRRAIGLGNSGTLGPNAALGPARRTLINRIRHQFRNHPQLEPAIRKVVGQIIGEAGISPKPRSPLAGERKQHADEWRGWAAAECDFDRRTSFAGAQAQVCWLAQRDGEAFARLHFDPAPDPWGVPFQVQILPTDMVADVTRGRERDGSILRNGVWFDARGRRIAYEVYRTHPDDAVGASSSETVRVPASEMLQVFDAMSDPGLVRGRPHLSRVLFRLAEGDKYDGAQLDRQLSAANFVFFTTTPSGELPSAFSAVADDQAGTAIEGQTVGSDELIIEPSGVYGLGPGEEVTAPPTPNMGTDYDAFTRRLDRQLAAGAEVPPWDWSGDYEKVNFTSGRIGLIASRTLWEMWVAHTLIPQFCVPIWRAWVRQAGMAGRITTRRITRSPRAYFAAEWSGEGFEWVDPLKEAQAWRILVEDGHASTSEVLERRGRDFDETMEERAEERATKDRLGEKLQTDQGGGGASSAIPPATDQPAPGDQPDAAPSPEGAASAA